ncbi:MAG: VacJ family lipoprotein [Caulobacter sp.]|nr:VacJ family lipoprotein [Caulobacter sp.]
MLLAAALVCAVATPVAAMASGAAGAGAPRDPLAPLNRVLFGFNAKVLDPFIVRPLTQGFEAVAPGVLRKGLRNALGNLREPATAANALLQGRPTVAAKATGRFLINSTVGVVGLFDVAGKGGIIREPADFGQTLGRWGVGEGPYIYVPVIGPTTLRDGLGGLIGYAADPVSQATGGLDTDFAIARSVIRGVEARSEADALLTSVMTDATDPYATVRGAYLQNRAAAVAAARGEALDLPAFDEPPPEEVN